MVHAGGHEAVGRHFAGAENLVGDDVATDGEVERLTHARVCRGMAIARVEHVVVDAQVGRDVGGVRQVVLQPAVLLGREFARDVDLAGAEALQGAVALLDGVVDHLIQRDLIGIVELRILERDDAGLRLPLAQLEGTVGDHLAGVGPVLAVLLHHMFRQRVGGVVRQLIQEVGRRALEGDLEGMIIHGTHAEGVRLGLAAVDGLGILDRIQDVGVIRGIFRRHDALERVHEVLGGHRLTV